ACVARVVSLGHEGIEETLHGTLMSKRGENGKFSLRPDQSRSFFLVTRDLKDIVSKPPFLLRLDGKTRPLNDNTKYVLTLDLHSEAQDVTRARIEIETRTGPDFSLTLLDQAVTPR